MATEHTPSRTPSNPWEYLLHEIRTNAQRVTWIENHVQINTARVEQLKQLEHEYGDPDDYEKLRVRASRELRAWLDQSRAERAHGAQIARAAVQAGLSERYIESVQSEAQAISGALLGALSVLDLSEADRERALAALRVQLEGFRAELGARHGAVAGMERSGIRVVEQAAESDSEGC